MFVALKLSEEAKFIAICCIDARFKKTGLVYKTEESGGIGSPNVLVTWRTKI